MRHGEKFEQLREQAVALRRAGRSRREIKALLGITSNATLDKALRGEPPPEWTRRPNAKDALRARARELREGGLDYEEIAGALGVSKSSVSLWVRDMPRPARLSYEESRKRAVEGVRRYWAAERPAREAKREATRAAAAAEIGGLSLREMLLVGAVAYWCEGAKSKPHNISEHVCFVNSDPGLIRFFLRFLGEAGVEPARLRFACTIHETADVAAAQKFWLRRHRRRIQQVSANPCSSGTTRGPCARTLARTTTGACASMCCRAPTCTGESKAGSARQPSSRLTADRVPS